MHSSVYFHKCARSQRSMVEIQHSQWLRFNAVNGQSPKNQCSQPSKHRKELVKVLICSRSRGYRV